MNWFLYDKDLRHERVKQKDALKTKTFSLRNFNSSTGT